MTVLTFAVEKPTISSIETSAVSNFHWLGTGQSNRFYIQENRAPISFRRFVHAVDYKGNLYVCPEMGLCAGGISIRGIAQWDGMKWHEIPGIDGAAVSAVAFDSTGILYTGGSFTAEGERPASTIMTWNGSSWKSLRTASGEEKVVSLAVDNSGMVYAAVSMGGTDTIVQWDGAKWRILGTIKCGEVPLSCVSDGKGNCYVAGCFDSINGIEFSNIACWNGNSWTALGKGLFRPKDAYYNGVHKICFDGTNLYVSGQIDSAGSIPVHNCAQWDGTSWHTIGNIEFSRIVDLETDHHGNLYISGNVIENGMENGMVGKWDGTAWTTIGNKSIDCPWHMMVDRTGNIYANFT
jgi:hypothetical protein